MTAKDPKKDRKGLHWTTKDLRNTADASHDVTIQWYTPPTALACFRTSTYAVLPVR